MKIKLYEKMLIRGKAFWLKNRPTTGVLHSVIAVTQKNEYVFTRIKIL